MTASPVETELKRASLTDLYKHFFAWTMAKGYKRYDDFIATYKRALLGELQGTVLEIGPGPGSNLAYYPPGILWIGVEPNPYMHHYLWKEAARLGISIDVKTGSAERIEAEDNSADAIVSTLVLCSVRDVPRVMQEVLRVLKPGGRFVFIEHIAAPRGTWQRWMQRLVRPVWRLSVDGCRPDQDTESALRLAGFERVECQHFLAPLPIVSPHIAGSAMKVQHSY